MTVRPRPVPHGLPTNVETDHPLRGLTPTLFSCVAGSRRETVVRMQPVCRPTPAHPTDSAWRGHPPARWAAPAGSTAGAGWSRGSTTTGWCRGRPAGGVGPGGRWPPRAASGSAPAEASARPRNGVVLAAGPGVVAGIVGAGRPGGGGGCRAERLGRWSRLLARGRDEVKAGAGAGVVVDRSDPDAGGVVPVEPRTSVGRNGCWSPRLRPAGRRRPATGHLP